MADAVWWTGGSQYSLELTTWKKAIGFEALHGGISISSRFAVTPCVLSQLSRSWGTGSEKNLIAQLVSRLSLSESTVQGRTNIGQLVSQLWLSEKYGSGRTVGTSRVLLWKKANRKAHFSSTYQSSGCCNAVNCLFSFIPSSIPIKYYFNTYIS